MKKLFRKIKNIFIIYVIFYLILGAISSCSAVDYDSEAGEYLAEYTKEFIATYGSSAVYDSSSRYPSWSSDHTIFYCCCTSGVYYMYYMALGINIYNYGFSSIGSDNLTSLANSSYWEEVSLSSTEPGDILVVTNSGSSHVEMVLSSGNSMHANFGSTSSGGAAKTHTSCSYSMKAFRLSSDVDVDTSGTVTVKSEDYEEGDFYFNGIPDGKYSIASGLNLKIVVNTLASIADYIIGILTYIVRVVIVGWTSIIDRLFSWTVNSMFGVSEDLGITGTEVDDQDSSTRITIESIFYGEYDLLDINIFE